MKRTLILLATALLTPLAPLHAETDIAGQPRERHAGAVVPGPFARLAKGKNAFRFSAGASASSFVANP